jgi:hypothetical protein
MTSRRHLHAVWLLLAVVACGGSGGSVGAGGGISGKRDAGYVSGAGGMIVITTPSGGRDAAPRDAGPADATSPNVFADAPAFNWNGPSCSSCDVDGGADDGRGGAGGQPGLDAAAGAGGMTGLGGSSSGGTTTQDAPGFKQDSGPGPSDAPNRTDTIPLEVGVLPDAQVDVRPDGGPGDAGAVLDVLPSGCTAEIVPVLPTLLPEGKKMVAAPKIKIVLRARVVSGNAPAGAAWKWRATVGDVPLAVAESSAQDEAAAAFLIESEGDYVFTATAGSCAATFSRQARGPEGCSACDYGADIQITPPPSAALPTQNGFYAYAASITLAAARTVRLFAKADLSLVPAYLRINNADGSLVTDGYGDPTVGFARPLLLRNAQKDIAHYEVLVVPMDGSGDGSVGATAPQLFVDQTESDLETKPVLTLAGGLAVTGTAQNAAGQGLTDVRVILSNQNPAAPAPGNLVFSSVGRTDPQGAYALAAQPGLYWASFSPPPGSGLAEATSPAPIDLRVAATLAFQWSTPTVAPLALQVVDANGKPAASVRVLVSATSAAPAGTMTYQPAGGQPVTQAAAGNLQREATSDKTGQVTFAALPAGATYDVLLVPLALGPLAATTEVSLTLPAGGLSQPVALLAEGAIAGQLVGDGAMDFSQVQVVAFDESQTVPEAPRAVMANADGTFSLGVSPGRAYAVLAWPSASTGLARTFIGPGFLQASAFSTTQKVQSSLTWSGTVAVENQSGGIAGASLRATCHPDYWRCVDPTIPLAEATTDASGAFVLSVPDPATR